MASTTLKASDLRLKSKDLSTEGPDLLTLAAILGAGILARRTPASAVSLAQEALGYAKALVEVVK